jgi:hypothetical protein
VFQVSLDAGRARPAAWTGRPGTSRRRRFWLQGEPRCLAGRGTDELNDGDPGRRVCGVEDNGTAQGIVALDFFTADLLNGAKVYVLAVIEHGSRRVRILGATEHPSRPGSCSRHGTC